MAEREDEVVIPVVREEIHAEAVPVQTGGVRVTKSVQSHDELVEQELAKGRVEVKRIKTDRVVPGPQEPRREGETLIIPVIAEMARTITEWVVTEEIHITQVEEHETVRQTVNVATETARVERLDGSGQPTGVIDESAVDAEVSKPSAETVHPEEAALRTERTPANERILSRRRSIIPDRKK